MDRGIAPPAHRLTPSDAAGAPAPARVLGVAPVPGPSPIHAAAFLSARSVHAFSLLELLMVLAILVTLGALAAPRYGDTLARYRVQSAARRVARDLNEAASLARQSSAPCTVTFTAATDQYTIEFQSVSAGATQTRPIALNAEPYLASIDAAMFGADAIVIFDGFGVPDSGGTVVVSVGRLTRTITLDASKQEVSIQ